MNHRTVLATIVALSLTAGAAFAGGTAQVKIVKAPKQVAAGQTFELAFAVQPNWPMKDRSLEPTVKAVCGKQEVTVAAVALKQEHQYKASLALPASGDWIITVDSKFCHTKMKPLTLRAGPAKGIQS